MSNETSAFENATIGGLILDSSGHLARFTALDRYERLTPNEILAITPGEFEAFEAEHARTWPGDPAIPDLEWFRDEAVYGYAASVSDAE